MNIVLLGAPASGKGTQGTALSTLFNIPHISSGNIIRQNIVDKTMLGNKAKEIINRGKLLDDKTTNAMMIDRLLKEDCSNGFILDGYPRTLPQAKKLAKQFKIDMAINIYVDEDIAVKRISGRRVCNNCNKTYHISNLSSEVCPICNNPLVIRDDDKLEVIKERYKVFNEQTKILLDYYKKQEVLFNVNGNVSIQEITQEILEIMKGINK